MSKNVVSSKFKSGKGLFVLALLLASGTIAAAAELPNGDLLIVPDEITETATFFPINVEGVQMEVFAVRAPDGTVRTAFNTCQVCYASGRGYYKQEGGMFVCQNCGNRFRTSDVELVHGGCNPVPITSRYKTVDERGITIAKSFLVRAKPIFARWKR